MINKALPTLAAGGILYGCFAMYMAKNYYQQSSMKRVFHNADPAYSNKEWFPKHA